MWKFLFENPVVRLYSLALRSFIIEARKTPGQIKLFGVLVTLCYFADFASQVMTFNGSWTGADFITWRTFLPWLAYAVACLFLVPFYAELWFVRPAPTGSVQPISGSGSSLTNGGGILIALMVLGTVSLPYDMLMLEASKGAAEFTIACTPAMRSQCESVDQGGIPAVVFGTVSPKLFRAKLEACVSVCSVESPRMRLLIEGAKKIEDAVDSINKR